MKLFLKKYFYFIQLFLKITLSELLYLKLLLGHIPEKYFLEWPNLSIKEDKNKNPNPELQKTLRSSLIYSVMSSTSSSFFIKKE